MKINRMEQKEQRGKGKSQREKDRQHAEGRKAREAGKERNYEDSPDTTLLGAYS